MISAVSIGTVILGDKGASPRTPYLHGGSRLPLRGEEAHHQLQPGQAGQEEEGPLAHGRARRVEAALRERSDGEAHGQRSGPQCT